jgi:hypothetical protein
LFFTYFQEKSGIAINKKTKEFLSQIDSFDPALIPENYLIMF